MKEIWKKIEGHPNYSVSDKGRVRNDKTSLILKYGTNGHGYLTVVLYPGRKRFYVHRLVSQTFLPNCNNLPQVNHLDENKENNAVTNLEWISAKDNCNFGTRNERLSKSRIINTRNRAS